MTWFYADDSDAQHEVAVEEFPELVASGAVRRDTLVWNETLTDWKECQSVLPELFSGPAGPPELSASQRKQITVTASTGPGSSLSRLPTGPPQQPADATAICALVFGVLGLMCLQIFSPVAIICGHIALKRANEIGDRSANKGLAIAGLATGYLGLLILVAIIVFYGIVVAVGIASEA